MGHTHVLVLGGGYAGVAAANHLGKRDDVAVTLVNSRPQFVERIRLHQYVAGTHTATADFAPLLGAHATLVVDTAARIDRDDHRVHLASGRSIGYDYLVYTAGSTSAAPQITGATQHAFPLATLDDAKRLRDALDQSPATAPVTVIGGGISGIELTAELAEQGRAVTLVCGQSLGPYLHPRTRARAHRMLTTLGAEIVEHAPANRVDPTAVHLADGQQRDSAVTIITTGFTPSPLAAASGLSTDEAGRLLVDETLTSLDDERIVAAGDSAGHPAGLRMSCQAATPLGVQAATTILSRMAGREPTPARLRFVGVGMSIGRRTGLIQLAHGDDTATRFSIGGSLGARIKEFACTAAVRGLAMEARRPGSITWLKGPRGGVRRKPATVGS